MKDQLGWIFAGLVIVAGIVGVLIYGIWHTGPNFENPANQNSFGDSSNSTSVAPSTSQNLTNNTITDLPSQESQQKIFKVADGPVTGATFVQTLHPTTTLARYVMQDNGHAFDIVLDSPGAVAQAVSNTTIPGTENAQWAPNGAEVFLQYLDGSNIKTLSITFPVQSTSSAPTPVKIGFFPDGAQDFAVSPDGKQIVYLLSTQSGVDGYISNADGSGVRKLFSLPLSQVLVSWPSQSTILVQSKSAAGVPGIVFSVAVKTGDVVPLIYANGLTAIADRTFSHVIYQADSSGGSSRSSYNHDVSKGLDAPLSFDPIPEKCVWGLASSTALYCATPLQFVPSNYLDAWHMGTESMSDGIFSYDISANTFKAIAVPGSTDGGIASDIASMAVSPDNRYLLFIKKGDRSLWAVRLFK